MVAGPDEGALQLPVGDVPQRAVRQAASPRVPGEPLAQSDLSIQAEADRVVVLVGVRRLAQSLRPDHDGDMPRRPRLGRPLLDDLHLGEREGFRRSHVRLEHEPEQETWLRLRGLDGRDNHGIKHAPRDRRFQPAPAGQRVLCQRESADSRRVESGLPPQQGRDEAIRRRSSVAAVEHPLHEARRRLVPSGPVPLLAAGSCAARPTRAEACRCTSAGSAASPSGPRACSSPAPGARRRSRNSAPIGLGAPPARPTEFAGLRLLCGAMGTGRCCASSAPRGGRAWRALASMPARRSNLSRAEPHMLRAP